MTVPVTVSTESAHRGSALKTPTMAAKAAQAGFFMIQALRGAQSIPRHSKSKDRAA
jgi:hypothetical protein